MRPGDRAVEVAPNQASLTIVMPSIRKLTVSLAVIEKVSTLTAACAAVGGTTAVTTGFFSPVPVRSVEYACETNTPPPVKKVKRMQIPCPPASSTLHSARAVHVSPATTGKAATVGNVAPM